MESITSHDLKLLRHRYIEDYGLPIQVLIDPYFSERLELFEEEYHALTDYKSYVEYICKEFNNNIQDFLESYHSLRDRIIETISNTEAYKDFLSNDEITKEIKEYKPSIGSVNLYTQEQVKKNENLFLSIDMKKANFQTLKWINPEIVLNCDTYEDLIRKFTNMECAIKSKRTREIIFGRLNPNRTMKYEKILIDKAEKVISQHTIITDVFDLFSINSDEIIYKVKTGHNFDKVIKYIDDFLPNEERLSEMTGLKLRKELFVLKCHQFKTQSSDKLMNVFVKEHTNGTKTYKCANEIYFPQTYKLINGKEITDNDLVFYYDKTELAKFLNPIEKV